MEHGQYIVDRWMVKIIRDICDEKGISFVGYSDDWLLELTHGNKTRRILGYRFDVNNSVASAVAGDKVAAYQVFAAAGLPAVEHRLVRTKAGSYSDWMDDLGRVVVKPLDGTSGHGVALLDNAQNVEEYIHMHPHIAAWAVSPFESIQSERRFVMFDGKVLCQYEKQPIIRNGLPMFNLGLGARAVNSVADPEEEALARQAMKVLELRLAAVDVIRVESDYKILEVNDGIMMENFMRQSEEYNQSGRRVYRSIISSMFLD